MHRTLMVVWPALATVAGVVSLLAAFGQATPFVEPATAQEVTSLGIDVNPDGNDATLLGTREVCLEVHSGDTFEVDVTVQNISQLAAWETYLAFDPAVVHVTDRNVQLFLSSTPSGNVFDLSESVPDDDGRYRIGGAIISDPPESVDGSGVLARLTVEARSSGLTDLSVGAIQTDAGKPVGPTLTDVNGRQIGDDDDDGLFDGPAQDARIAVDQSCPNDGGLVAALASSGGGGLAWWVVAAVAFGIVITAGFGGLALIAMRRTGSPRAS